MDSHQSLSADQIIARIASDKALHEALQQHTEEMRGFRGDIKRLRQEMANPSPARYLTTLEVAAMFCISAETVRRRVRDGAWPVWRDGHQIRFGPEEIAAIVEWGRLKAPEPVLTPLEKRRRNRVNAARGRSYFS